MKKFCFLTALLFLLEIGNSNAQYTVLLNFDSANGAYPNGSLTFYANKLYGMTYEGGAYNDGCIFRIDTNGTGYKDLFDFNDTNGAYPTGDLIMAGNRMYGMTFLVGTEYDTGCIFSIDTDGSDYRILHIIAGMDANHVFSGGLTLSGKKLFGTTQTGGLGGGNIFSIDTNGVGYRDLFDFNGTTGFEPNISLTVFGNTLYGTTKDGGEYNLDGIIFSIDTDGNGYTNLHSFNDTEGANPNGNLVISGGVLYGVTNDGGTNGAGCIFSINSDGSGFNIRHNFNFDSGGWPSGSLILSRGKLFGMANGGVLFYDGVIFSTDTNGSQYEDIFDFDGTNGGGQPGGIDAHWASLIINGNNLYGMTFYGGTDNIGVIFSLNYKTVGIDELTTSKGTLNVYPNPNNGIFTIALSHAELVSASQTIEIYNVLGEKVLTQTPVRTGTGGLRSAQGDNLIDLTGQPNGIYLYRVISENGNLLGEGKIIIDK